MVLPLQSAALTASPTSSVTCGDTFPRGEGNGDAICTSLKPGDAKGAAVWQLLFGGVSVFAVDAPGVDAAFVA